MVMTSHKTVSLTNRLAAKRNDLKTCQYRTCLAKTYAIPHHQGQEYGTADHPFDPHQPLCSVSLVVTVPRPYVALPLHWCEGSIHCLRSSALSSFLAYLATLPLICSCAAQVLRSLGLNLNLLACRCQDPIEASVREKLVSLW